MNKPVDFFAEHPKAVAMNEALTAVFEKSKYGYIGYIEELPGANTQGKTLAETKQNLIEAVALVLQANRELAAHL